jgi:hypothetical protein
LRFRETFREEEGRRRRGTFGKHLLQVEVNAREPPSQLQEALKESAKVDAEYNLHT